MPRTSGLDPFSCFPHPERVHELISKDISCRIQLLLMRGLTQPPYSFQLSPSHLAPQTSAFHLLVGASRLSSSNQFWTRTNSVTGVGFGSPSFTIRNR